MSHMSQTCGCDAWIGVVCLVHRAISLTTALPKDGVNAITGGQVAGRVVVEEAPLPDDYRREGVEAAIAYLQRHYGDEMCECVEALRTRHWGPVLDCERVAK